MKKMIVIALLLAAAGFLFAEDLVFANLYIVTEDGVAYGLDDLDEDLPVIELVELLEGDERAILYYNIGNDDYFIEPVDMELLDEYGEYSSIPHFLFDSNRLGPVIMHIGEDGEVQVDELTAMLSSYTYETDSGVSTWFGVSVVEDIQPDEERADAFIELAAEMKDTYKEYAYDR